MHHDVLSHACPIQPHTGAQSMKLLPINFCANNMRCAVLEPARFVRALMTNTYEQTFKACAGKRALSASRRYTSGCQYETHPV